MNIRMIDKLRGKALPGTHLVRYQFAVDTNNALVQRVRCVLDVVCPDCGAKPGEQCNRN